MHVDPGLRRLALRTLLAAYPGRTPPEWALALVRDGLAGFTLFGRNIEHADQLAAATAALRLVRPDVLLAIDEEGGDVTRLAHATGSPYPGNAALGRVGDATLTEQVYQAIGRELAGLGINVDLAPTVDVNTADDNPIIGTRSFGSDPRAVAEQSAAAVRGLQAAGVSACAKHFPGHGATVTDSHYDMPTVDAPLSVLRARDLPPFAAVVAAGARAVMTAHIRVPALTGDGPATFSRAVLHDLLRREYGFTGAVITDALEMAGAAGPAGGVGPAAVRALRAGADLLCIGARVDAALVETVAEHVATAVASGDLDRARVEEAASRAAALATWATLPPTRPLAPEGIGYAAARRAVRVEGTVDALQRPLVLQLVSTSTIAEGPVPWGLEPHAAGAEQLRVVAATADPEVLRTRAGERPIVVVGRRVHRLPGGRELVEALAARHPVTVVEMGWPSAWRPAGVRAFVTTYGASHANGRAAAEVLGLAPPVAVDLAG
jgi:beta-N-acetylhexosaminidase